MNKYKIVHLVILLVSVSALFFAYVGEFFFGLLPCKLCMMQRVAFFVIVLASLSSLFFKKFCSGLYIVFGLLIINAFIAGYNVAVENHWVEYDARSCTNISNSTDTSYAQIMERLLNKHAVPCDRPTFVFGLSLAAWNMFLCLGLVASGLIFIFKKDEAKNK